MTATAVRLGGHPVQLARPPDVGALTTMAAGVRHMIGVNTTPKIGHLDQHLDHHHREGRPSGLSGSVLLRIVLIADGPGQPG
jgi:hypothetical protein